MPHRFDRVTATLRAPIAIAICLIVFKPLGAVAQQVPTRTEQQKQAYIAAMERADQKIAEAAEQGSEVMQNLEYLSTYIGPRLTGSPAMQQASHWTLDMFRKYGLDAHLETATIPKAWTRGNDWGELVAPVQHWMTVRSAAWGAPTPGPITARLVMIAADTKPEDILAHPEKYKDAIVLTDAPAGPIELPVNPTSAYNAIIPASPIPLPHGMPKTAADWAAIMPLFENYSKLLDALGKTHPAAMLRDSQLPHAMLAAGGAAGVPFPVAYVSHSDYQWLLRLAKDGKGTLRINLDGKLSDGPAPVSNTVAQIRGSEHPEQQVIIGGHLDSWDLGQGAVDNGTGVMAVLEAARILKSLGWTPKRTLTFVLFYGEEQGERGSIQFVRDHASEMDSIAGVLIDDTGAGRITNISLGKLWATGPLMDEIYQPLQNVFGLDPLTNEYLAGSDHDPFRDAGVPAYLATQEPAHYGEAHHSNGDVIELVSPAALRQQAAVLAAWMWNVSEMPEVMPHHGK